MQLTADPYLYKGGETINGKKKEGTQIINF